MHHLKDWHYSVILTEAWDSSCTASRLTCQQQPSPVYSFFKLFSNLPSSLGPTAAFPVQATIISHLDNCTRYPRSIFDQRDNSHLKCNIPKTDIFYPQLPKMVLSCICCYISANSIIHQLAQAKTQSHLLSLFFYSTAFNLRVFPVISLSTIHCKSDRVSLFLLKPLHFSLGLL